MCVVITDTKQFQGMGAGAVVGRVGSGGGGAEFVTFPAIFAA